LAEMAEMAVRNRKNRPDPKLVHARNEFGAAICGSKVPNGICRVEILDPENGRCQRHHGFKAKGAENPRYIHGGYSKYRLPGKLQEDYEHYLGREDLPSMAHELAIIDTFIQQMMEQMDANGMDPQMMEFLHKHFERMETVIRNDPSFEPPQYFMSSFMACYHKVSAGRNNLVIQHQVEDKMKTRAFMAGTENRRKADEAKAVSNKDLLQVVLAILAIVLDVCGRDNAKEVGRRFGLTIPVGVMAQAGELMGPLVAMAQPEEGDESEDEQLQEADQ
jgi:hypothetical protein